MNLLDCSLSYFVTDPAVLKLRPKALQAALHLHNGADRSSVPERLVYQLGKLVEPVTANDQSLMLPTKLDFGDLSYAATKALISCYRKAKHSRKPFRFTCTREELSEAASLSLPHSRKALKELESKRLIEVRQLWRKGVQISLLDPEYGSGTPLYWIAMFNRDRLEGIPAYEWYRTLLHDPNIPIETRHEWDSRETDYTLPVCPFCGRRKSLRLTLILNPEKSGYEKDAWFCHGCKRGGDVRRLWGLLHFYIDRHDWREALMRKEVGEDIL